MKVWDYSDNHYFLDTIYTSSFVDYYNNINISSQTADLAVADQNFEVWVQTDVIQSVTERPGCMLIYLLSLLMNITMTL